jgi:hypothetical protein
MLLVSMTMMASAQSGQTSTSVLVQNLSSSEASVVIDFYNTGGTNTGSKSGTLDPEGSITFDQRYSSGDPGEDPFQGAAILSSNQPVAAVVQAVRTGGSGGVNSYEAYNGVGSTAQTIKAPLLLRGIPSAGKMWNTTMAIQNTNVGASAAVTITFTPDPAVGLGSAYTYNTTIPGGGSEYVDQADQTQLGTTFYGSAVVEADQDIGVVVTSGTTDGSVLIAYPTYTAGSTTVYLPGAMKNIPSMGYNYFTSVTIVNLGGSGDPDPIVEVDYKPQSGTVSGAYTTTVGTATTIDMRYDSHITSSTFMGAVVLESTNGTPIAAMLNTRGDHATSGAATFATTYGGLTSSATTVYMPYNLKYIPSAGFNWSDTILIQNLDPSAGDLNVQIVYKEDPLVGTDTYTSTVTGISDFTFVDLRNDTALVESTFYGSVKIVSTNGRPFGTVALVRGSGGSGDALSSYQGVSE